MARPRPSRTFFWSGLVVCLLALIALPLASTGRHTLWLGARSYAMLGGGCLQFALFHKGTLGLDAQGRPGYFTGSPPVVAQSIPVWYIVLVASVLTLLAWAWGRRRSASACPACGHCTACPACGYPTHGLPSSAAACPECGALLLVRRSRFLRRSRCEWALLALGVAACIALMVEMRLCRGTPRLFWLTGHTYCVFKYRIMELACFSSGVMLDARGVPHGFLNKPPVWLAQIPLWSLLAFLLALTGAAWLWPRRPWPGPCPACGFRRGARSTAGPDREAAQEEPLPSAAAASPGPTGEPGPYG